MIVILLIFFLFSLFWSKMKKYLPRFVLYKNEENWALKPLKVAIENSEQKTVFFLNGL